MSCGRAISRSSPTFVYLCTVIDVFTGEVLGFNISRTHDAGFVRLAIERAIQRTQTLPTWFHSDQGSEYASEYVRSWLTDRSVTISMNPKGSPWCNGSQESFFGRFKVEFGDFERIKSKLKMPPAELRETWAQRQRQLSAAIHTYPQVMSLPLANPPHSASSVITSPSFLRDAVATAAGP
jgi:transposase InsO family protein